MYSCVLKNKEGIIFDEGKDFETLRETFKWASNRGRWYVVHVADYNGNEWEACVAESLSEMSFRLKTIDGLLRTSGYATMNEANFDDIVKKCKCNEFGGTYYLRF
jgi:hypothetical protein